MTIEAVVKSNVPTSSGMMPDCVPGAGAPEPTEREQLHAATTVNVMKGGHPDRRANAHPSVPLRVPTQRVLPIMHMHYELIEGIDIWADGTNRIQRLILYRPGGGTNTFYML